MFRYNRVGNQWPMVSRTIGIMIFCLLGITSGAYSQERWKELSVESKAEFFGVFFVSNDTGYVVGDSATAIKTTDGGMTWEKMVLPEKINSNKNNIGFRDIFFIDKQRGYISGYGYINRQGIVLRTEDGGKNWKIVLEDSIAQIIEEIQYQIPHFTRLLLRGKGRKELYTIGGSSEVILLSQDSGTTWKQLPQAFDSTVIRSQETVYFYSIAFQDSLNGLAGVYYNHSSTQSFDICRTSDGGLTWEKPFFPAGHFPIGNIYYVGNNRWLKTGGVNYIEFSLDTGKTWQIIQDSLFAYKLYFYQDSHIYGPIYGFELLAKSTDSGYSWVTLPTGVNTYRVNDMSVPSELIAYAVGYGKSGGQIFKTTNGGGVPLSVDHSEPYHQLTVYPNPTTSTLQLTYKLSSQEQPLAVSDLLGKIVLSTTLSPETTETTLNLSELPAGTYFCRLGGEVRVVVVVR